MTCMITLSLASCGGNTNKSNMIAADEDSVAADTTDSVATADTTSSATETSTDNQSGGWFYDKNVDDLTGNVTAVNGYLVSKNSVEYDSGKTTKLMIALRYGKLSASVQNAVQYLLLTMTISHADLQIFKVRAYWLFLMTEKLMIVGEIFLWVPRQMVLQSLGRMKQMRL